MSDSIKVTTGDLRNQAKSITDVAMLVSDISDRNNRAINKMTSACSFLRVGSISFCAKHLIQQLTSLIDVLNNGASKALECACAFEDANDSLKSKFDDWYNDVKTGSATQEALEVTTGTVPVSLEGYLSTVTDAEYARISGIWESVCDDDDPFASFMKRLSDLPDNDPLRYLSPDQISINNSITGMAAVAITDNSGNALVIFAGTNPKDFRDLLADIHLSVGMVVNPVAPMTFQEMAAYKMIKELQKTHPNIVTTGHSLGGYIATSMALRFPSISKCTVFDPPGRYDTIFQDALNRDAVSKITVYEANGSTVSSVGAGTGEMHKLDVNENGSNFFDHNHSIDEIYHVLGGAGDL